MNSIVNLGDVATVITKGTTPTTVGYQFVESGIPFLRAEDVNGGFVSFADAEKRITPECHKAFARSQLKSGDLLITIAGSVGRVGIVPDGIGTANCNQAISIVRLKPGLFDLQFLCYYLRTSAVQQRFRQQGTTATITNVSLAQIRDVKVPFLSLAEQRRIVDLLSRAEGIVRLRREAEKKAAELIPALFLDMFGDPNANPKRWPMPQLGGFLTFLTSGSRGWAEYYAESGARFIRSLDVRMNDISADAAVYVHAPEGAEAERTRVKVGDVLLTITGSQIGRVAAAPADLEGSYISQHVAILRLNAEIEPKFLATFLSLDVGGQREISRLQYGQTKPGLNLKQIREFLVPHPPLSLQQNFVETVESIRSIQSQQSAATLKAQATFHALLADAFNL